MNTPPPAPHFGCGSFAPVRIEHECGAAAAWLVETLVVPSVQGHRLPLSSSYEPIRFLFVCLFVFQSSCISLSEGLLSQSISIALPIQVLRGIPCLGPFSVVPRNRHIDGPPDWGPTLYIGALGT